MVEAGLQAEPFADDGDQNVDADGDPDLGLDRVLAGAEKALDTQMLLDPFEEQFHLPALLVDLRDDQGRQREVVGLCRKRERLQQKSRAIRDRFWSCESSPSQPGGRSYRWKGTRRR